MSITTLKKVQETIWRIDNHRLVETNIDVDVADNLVLYGSTTKKIYELRLEYQEKFAKQMKNNTYQRDEAILLLTNNFIPVVLRNYRNEIKNLPPVSTETKIGAAYEFEDIIMSNIKES